MVGGVAPPGEGEPSITNVAARVTVVLGVAALRAAGEMYVLAICVVVVAGSW